MEAMRTSLPMRWLNFLLFLRDTPHNRTLLGQYFSEHFFKTPEDFYRFTFSLEEFLKKPRHRSNLKKIAQFYLSIISPLCERFGFYERKNSLDDLCFFIVDPRAYTLLDHRLADYKKHSGEWIDRILVILKDLLSEFDYNGEVEGRYKSHLSVYQKLQKKQPHHSFTLNDTFAFRIILHTEEIHFCFEIANLLHDRFRSLPRRFKDYITIPKINGYQSLHLGLTDVIPHLDLPIEVQIRTESMHHFAEDGVASHWIYGKNKKSMLSAPGIAYDDLVYFFSFKGDFFALPQGATLLDFAYHLHSDLGHRLGSGIVNGVPQPVGYALEEGDIVELVTDSTSCLQSNWLSHAKTRHARQKIGDALRR